MKKTFSSKTNKVKYFLSFTSIFSFVLFFWQMLRLFRCYSKHSAVLRSQEIYKHSCLWTPLTIIHKSFFHLQVRGANIQFRRTADTVRVTRKPADTGERRNPGVTSLIFQSLSVLFTSSGSQRDEHLCHTRWEDPRC